MGERLWYDEYDPKRYVGIPERSVKGVLIVQDWDKAAEIFTSQDEGESMGKIFKLLPRSAYVDVEIRVITTNPSCYCMCNRVVSVNVPPIIKEFLKSLHKCRSGFN